MTSPTTVAQKRERPVALFAVIVATTALGAIAQTACNNLLDLCAMTFALATSDAQWLTTLYPLVLGITIPVAAYLLKRIQLRPLVLTSIALLLVGCLLSWMAPVYALVLTGRVLQAVATGICLPMMQACAMDLFPPQKIGVALGVASGVALGFAPCFGPLMSGVIAGASGNWQAFFLVLAIFSAVLLVCGIVCAYNATATDERAHLDIPSVVLSAFGFGGLLLGLTQASNVGFGDPSTIGALVVGAVALVAFIIRQKGEKHLISLAIFANRRFSVGTLLVGLVYACCLSSILVLSLLITSVDGLSPAVAGIVTLPAAICNVIVGLAAGIATDKLGKRPVVIVGSLLLLAGSAMVLTADQNMATWYLGLSFAIRFAGMTTLLPSLIAYALSTLEPRIIPDGVSANSACQQLFAAFGMAIAVLIMTGFHFSAFGVQAAFGMATAFAAVVLIVAIPSIKEGKPENGN